MAPATGRAPPKGGETIPVAYLVPLRLFRGSGSVGGSAGRPGHAGGGGGRPGRRPGPALVSKGVGAAVHFALLKIPMIAKTFFANLRGHLVCWGTACGRHSAPNPHLDR